ncbi:MAG TPA: ABC transporter substrate-binding protein [Burkholderiales bacterium]|nr:ABC transporter substrate-binding protein [Burkholderiales bacterium]
MWPKNEGSSIGRRAVLAAAAAALVGGFSPATLAQQKEIKVAVIAPISGPWARQGQLIQMGAEMAVDEINQKGGIKSLGGAKLKLVVADAGDSAEKAKNAAQRLTAQEPDLVGGTGAWLSTFTLAVTEVTERAQIPWLTLSFADSITDRGFKYVFQTSPVASRQSSGAVPALLDLAKVATGKAPSTAGIIGDNSASPVFFLKPLREGGLEKMGIKVVMDETYTPPLSDATPLIQKVRSTHPEFLLFISSTISDLKLGLEKMNEFRLAKGVVPVIGNGAHMGAPEVLKNVPPDLLEGVMFIVADWGMKGQEPIIEMFKKRTGEPWITQDAITGYGDMWILKEALERAKSTDKVKVADEIRKLHLTTGPAGLAFPGGVQFDEKGRRMNAPLVIVQWQKGVPLTVSPVDRALAKPYWPKR